MKEKKCPDCNSILERDFYGFICPNRKCFFEIYDRGQDPDKLIITSGDKEIARKRKEA